MGCPGFSRFPDRFRHLSIPVSAVPPGSPRSWEELTPAVLYRDRDGMPGRTSRFPPRFPRVAPRFSRRLPGCSRVLPDSPQVAPEAFGLPDTRLPRFLPGGSGGFHGRFRGFPREVPGGFHGRFRGFPREVPGVSTGGPKTRRGGSPGGTGAVFREISGVPTGEKWRKVGNFPRFLLLSAYRILTECL